MWMMMWLCVADVSLTGHLSADVAADVVVFNLWLTRAVRGLPAIARAIPSGYGTFQSKAFRPLNTVETSFWLKKDRNYEFRR